MSVETEVIRMTPRVMMAISKMTEELTKAVMELLKKHEENELIKKITAHVNSGGDVDYQICKSFAYKDLVKKLTEKKIPHAVMQDKESGLIVVVTRDVDRDKVRDAKNELYEEQRRISRISTDEFLRLNAGKYVISVDNLTEVQAKLFQERAQKYNFVMSADRAKDGTYTVRFARKDIDKAKLALDGIAVATVGTIGKYNNKRISEEMNKMSDITMKIANPQQEFFVVSASNKNEYIHINSEGFSHYRNNRLIREEKRTDERFVSLTYNQIMSLTKPAILSKEQFESPDAQRDIYIKKASVSTVMSAEDIRLAQIELRAKQLIEAKMSLDNGNQPENISSFYNGEVSFSEFFEHEIVNDNHDNEELKRYAASLDALSEEDKKVALNYIKEAYAEASRFRYESTFVDAEMLAKTDLTTFIENHAYDKYQDTKDKEDYAWDAQEKS